MSHHNRSPLCEEVMLDAVEGSERSFVTEFAYLESAEYSIKREPFGHVGRVPEGAVVLVEGTLSVSF